MANLVSFHGVPMPRGLAFAIYHIEKHGGLVTIFSADRTATALAEHNHQFGTHLHSQAWLIAMHAKDPQHYAPANPLNRTSHCYRSDGNPAYKGRPAGAKLPWYMLGLDLTDKGTSEHPDRFIRVGRSLGYKIVQPYPVGSEHHHCVFQESPIRVLEAYNVIDRSRG